MSVWHAPVRQHLYWGSQSRDSRTITLIRRLETPQEQYEVYLLRWERGGAPLSPTLDPEGWVELWPRPAVAAQTLEEARRGAQDLLERFEVNPSSGDVDRRPHRAHHLERVSTLYQADGQGKAVILRHPDHHYEIHYVLHDGSSPFEWDWVEARTDEITFADSLRSAEETAQKELRAIIAAYRSDRVVAG